MDNSKFVIPNLFIVGAPKCGTTALHTYLGQHPEIFMAKDKENNHFATDLIPLTDPFRSDEKYFEMFKDAGDKKIVGESSVFYMLSKVAVENIYHFNPNAKIIIMLRNPVDMLQSYHAQLIFNRDEDITDFEAALNAELERKNGTLKIKDGLRFIERLFYSEVVSYTEQVQRYLALFDKEQVQIIIYDDFKKVTAGVYQKTLEFLNVDATFQTDFTVINARKVISKNIFLKKIEQHSQSLNLLKKMVPKPFRKYLYSVLKGSESVKKSSPPMDLITRKRLQRIYSSEIEKLSILLGRDLNYWCNTNK
jgi:hypothetical protein